MIDDGREDEVQMKLLVAGGRGQGGGVSPSSRHSDQTKVLKSH